MKLFTALFFIAFAIVLVNGHLGFGRRGTRESRALRRSGERSLVGFGRSRGISPFGVRPPFGRSLLPGWRAGRRGQPRRSPRGFGKRFGLIGLPCLRPLPRLCRPRPTIAAPTVAPTTAAPASAAPTSVTPASVAPATGAPTTAAPASPAPTTAP